MTVTGDGVRDVSIRRLSGFLSWFNRQQTGRFVASLVILSGIEVRDCGDREPDDRAYGNGKRGTVSPGFESYRNRESDDEGDAEKDAGDERDLHHPAVIDTLRVGSFDLWHTSGFEEPR